MLKMLNRSKGDGIAKRLQKAAGEEVTKSSGEVVEDFGHEADPVDEAIAKEQFRRFQDE